MKNFKLNEDEMLLRNELKTIMGGYIISEAPGLDEGCSVSCSSGYACCTSSGCTCNSAFDDDSGCTSGGKGASSCSES